MLHSFLDMPSKTRKFSQAEVEGWGLEAVSEWLISVSTVHEYNNMTA